MVSIFRKKQAEEQDDAEGDHLLVLRGLEKEETCLIEEKRELLALKEKLQLIAEEKIETMRHRLQTLKSEISELRHQCQELENSVSLN